jgi:hypothetical protein
MNNNAALRVFISKGLGGFDGGFAVAVLNDNVASIFTEIFFECVTLKAFNQNKGVHAIFVSKEMLDRDPEFEESLLDKAQKQQDLVVMGYDSEGT